MSSIQVKYFALLKEEAGINQESLKTNALTYKDLYLELKETHKFSLGSDHIQVAVNDEYCSLDSKVSEGAKVVFIPPVAGG